MATNIVLNFKDCTLKQLDEMFNLNPLPLKRMTVLQDWLNGSSDITEAEQSYLLILQQYLQEHVDDWNEQELSLHFIGPVFSLVRFDYERKFNLFAQRTFGGVVDGIELSGKPDEIIATGFREPKKPFFCFQEFKKEQESQGDPAGQTLAAMLVAQEINEHQFPIYGCYVRGRQWHFIALQGKEYAISDSYTATKNDLFDILRILKVLKQRIIQQVMA